MPTAVQKNLVISNEKYASSFTEALEGKLPLPPAKKYLVVTCMDARIDPASAFGINLGDAHVIRNAGGSAKDALRSIVISEQLLGTTEILLVKHTDCGMLTFSNNDAHQLVEKNLGAGVQEELKGLDFLPFPELDQAVKDDLAFLEASRLIPGEVAVSGWVYDVGSGKKPFTLDTVALTQFVLFSILSTPPNFLWQEWLEDTFPGHTPDTTSAPSTKAKQEPKEITRVFTTSSGEVIEKKILSRPPSPSAAEETKRLSTIESRTNSPSSKLNIRNTACKFLLDQTVGALLNTIGFIAGLGALKGKNGEQISAAIKNESVSMIVAGYKLWPLVSIISFTLIPFQWRLAFASLVGVGWGVFLSLAAGGQ
ncbi:MAG: hypothetical protein Q9157_000251 [Trypethelium eluteriae]